MDSVSLNTIDPFEAEAFASLTSNFKWNLDELKTAIAWNSKLALTKLNQATDGQFLSHVTNSYSRNALDFLFSGNHVITFQWMLEQGMFERKPVAKNAFFFALYWNREKCALALKDNSPLTPDEEDAIIQQVVNKCWQQFHFKCMHLLHNLSPGIWNVTTEDLSKRMKHFPTSLFRRGFFSLKKLIVFLKDHSQPSICEEFLIWATHKSGSFTRGPSDHWDLFKFCTKHVDNMESFVPKLLNDVPLWSVLLTSMFWRGSFIEKTFGYTKQQFRVLLLKQVPEDRPRSLMFQRMTPGSEITPHMTCSSMEEWVELLTVFCGTMEKGYRYNLPMKSFLIFLHPRYNMRLKDLRILCSYVTLSGVTDVLPKKFPWANSRFSKLSPVVQTIVASLFPSQCPDQLIPRFPLSVQKYSQSRLEDCGILAANFTWDCTNPIEA